MMRDKQATKLIQEKGRHVRVGSYAAVERGIIGLNLSMLELTYGAM